MPIQNVFCHVFWKQQSVTSCCTICDTWLSFCNLRNSSLVMAQLHVKLSQRETLHTKECQSSEPTLSEDMAQDE